MELPRLPGTQKKGAEAPFFIFYSLTLLVQVMGNAVTLTALREFGMHLGRMRILAMTALTFGNHLVFCLVAGRAGKLGVLGRIGGYLLVDVAVASSAKR